MDSKEVLTLVKTLEKSKSDEQTVLEILSRLDKEVVPTEKLLRETKVGVEVNKFKKSTNVEIAKLVKKMISSWKDAINRNKKLKQQQQPAKEMDTTNANGVSTDKERTTSPSDATVSSPKKQTKFTSTKPRNSKNDGVNTVVYNDKLRDSVVKALYDALAKESEHPPASILHTVKSLSLIHIFW